MIVWRVNGENSISNVWLIPPYEKCLRSTCWIAIWLWLSLLAEMTILVYLRALKPGDFNHTIHVTFINSNCGVFLQLRKLWMQLNGEHAIDYEERLFFYLTSKIFLFIPRSLICVTYYRNTKKLEDIISSSVTHSLWNH